MTTRTVFRPQADEEVGSARQWYEQRRLGLGQEFGAAVDATIARIEANPEAFPRVHGETRRAIVRGFPYGLYFRVSTDEIVILAVTHGRRHPRRWQSRI